MARLEIDPDDWYTMVENGPEPEWVAAENLRRALAGEEQEYLGADYNQKRLKTLEEWVAWIEQAPGPDDWQVDRVKRAHRAAGAKAP